MLHHDNCAQWEVGHLILCEIGKVLPADFGSEARTARMFGIAVPFSLTATWQCSIQLWRRTNRLGGVEF